MEKITEKITELKHFLNRLRNKEISSADVTALISVIILSLIAFIALILIIKYWVALLGIVIVIAAVLDHFKKPNQQQPLPTAPTDYIVAKCLYHVLQQIYDRIGVRKPLDLEEIASNTSIVMKNNIEMFHIRTIKSHLSPTTNEEIGLAAKFTQARINDHLKQARVDFVPYASPDGQLPIIYIDQVIDDYAYLDYHIIFIDSEYKLNYIRSKLSNKSLKDPRPPIDKDF